MLAQLIPKQGGPPITLHRPITVIGRSAKLCDLVIDHTNVSKQHCILVKTDGLPDHLPAVDADSVVLDYRSRSNSDEWQDMHYPVYLAWSGCNYGGRRGWWLCPAAGCGRRVAVLYGGKVYACRHCHKLAYQTQREQAHDRAGSRADTIRKRLGWEAGILNLPGGKPKGMHWRTFERLQAAHDAHTHQALAGMAAKLGIMRGRLGV